LLQFLASGHSDTAVGLGDLDFLYCNSGSVLSVESNQNVESKTKNVESKVKNVESKTAFGQLILMKIINIVATICLKGIKIQFRLGLCPRPHWGSLEHFHRPLAGFKRAYF